MTKAELLAQLADVPDSMEVMIETSERVDLRDELDPSDETDALDAHRITSAYVMNFGTADKPVERAMLCCWRNVSEVPDSDVA